MEKLSALREAYAEIVRMCHEIDYVSLHGAVIAIQEDMDLLENDQVERGLSLLAEALIHVNDLDDELFEQYEDVIDDINELADQIRDDINCS